MASTNTESFADFVKKYTLVPNKFVEDFFNVLPINDDYDPKAFLVSFDIVYSWLAENPDSSDNKTNFKRRLTKNFEKDVDYEIRMVKKNIPGINGREVEDIWMTVECFKKFCMKSSSTKGKQVQDYYLQLEETLRKYHVYIRKELENKIEMQRNRINQLERNQKPPIKTRKGCIYFFMLTENECIMLGITKQGNRRYIKLGKAGKKKIRKVKLEDGSIIEEEYFEENSLAKRFNTYNSAFLDRREPDFFLEVDFPDTIEACVKNTIKDRIYRHKKEIYLISPEVLKGVIDKCIELQKSYEALKKELGDEDPLDTDSHTIAIQISNDNEELENTFSNNDNEEELFDEEESIEGGGDNKLLFYTEHLFADLDIYLKDYRTIKKYILTSMLAFTYFCNGFETLEEYKPFVFTNTFSKILDKRTQNRLRLAKTFTELINSGNENVCYYISDGIAARRLKKINEQQNIYYGNLSHKLNNVCERIKPNE